MQGWRGAFKFFEFKWTYLFFYMTVCEVAFASSTTAKIIFLGRQPQEGPTKTTSSGTRTDKDSSKEEDKEQDESPGRISGLIWKTPTEMEVQLLSNPDGSYQLEVPLEWTFPDKNWNFIEISENIRIQSSANEYHIQVPLTSEQTLLKLMAVSPAGDLKNESVEIDFPTYSEFGGDLDYEKSHPFWYMGYLGISYLNLSQSLLPNLNEWTASFGLAGNYRFKTSNLSVRGNACLAVPFTSYGMGGVNATLFEGGLYATKDLLPERKQWSLSVSLGGYYDTLWATNNAIGFQNIYGPQLFPTLSYRLKNEDLVFLTAKYSPIMNGKGLGFFSLDNREIRVDLEWRRKFKNQHQLGLLTGFRDLVINGLSTSLYPFSANAHMQSINISIGLHW
jgi:hypothetical protein